MAGQFKKMNSRHSPLIKKFNNLYIGYDFQKIVFQLFLPFEKGDLPR